MPSPLRSALTGIAAIAVSVTVSACGGAGTMTAVAPSTQAEAPTYALGLVPADAATLAALPQVRHADALTFVPASADLSRYMPAVGNQGSEGSCAAWSAAYAMRGYEARRDVWASIAPQTANPADNFSPAYVYNQLDGGADNGISFPAALTLMERQGVATLADMPYVAGQFRTQPTSAARADAAKYALSSFGYIAPTDFTSIKAEIANGVPVMLAIKVYNNFFALRSGQVYTSVSGAYAGGHAVTIVGYDNAKGAFKVINSWGTGWGTAGYGWIAYAVMPQIALEAYSAIDNHGPPAAVATTVAEPEPTHAPTPAPTHAPTPKPTAKPKRTS